MHNAIDIFLNVLVPVLKIAAEVAGAFIFFKIFRGRDWAGKMHRHLSLALIYVTLPALLFAGVVVRDIAEVNSTYPGWYFMPLAASAMIACGAGIGRLVSVMLPRRRNRIVVTLMGGFNNAGYLPIAIALGVFPRYPDLILLIPLYLLGVTPLLWSMSPMLLSMADDENVESADASCRKPIPWKRMITPPLIAILSALVALVAGSGPWLDSISLGNYTGNEWVRIVLMPVGKSTVHLAMFVLGGALARLRFRKPRHPAALLLSILTRQGIVPLLVLGIVLLLRDKIPQLIALLLLIESCTPTATNTIVQARAYTRVETQVFIAEALLYQYAASLLTMTFWLSVFRVALGER